MRPWPANYLIHLSFFKGMITTLIFDLNQVLVTFSRTDEEGLYEKELGVSMKEFWKAAWPHIHPFVRGETSMLEWFSYAFDDLGLDKSLIPAAIELHKRFLKPVEGINGLLEKVKHKRMILLAGDGTESIRLKVHGMGFAGYFDSIYTTCEEGILKTDPEIYRRVLEKEGLKPEECLFIDDQPEFIDTAKGLGIRTILFEDAAKLERELKGLGVI